MTLTRQRTYSVVAGMLLVAFAIALFAAGHGKAATTPTPPPAPEVSVIYVQGEDVATYREYPARTYACDLVDIRGRVDGYIERRTFDIGSDVRAGQVLYVLDVRPYEAEVERARGALAQATADIAQAEAALLKARQDVERLEPLVKEEAAPRQDLDNALAARQAGEAAVVARKATVEANRAILRSAELNLEYATIRAPIGGRVGESLLQVGGLVTRTSPQPLTTIVPLDPVWVRFQVSEAELPLFEPGRRGSLAIEWVLLAGYHKTGEERAQQEQLVAALRDATRLSTDRYQGGLDSYLQVLDAQRNLFRSELDLTTLQRQELTSIVELYRALGGGWNQ